MSDPHEENGPFEPTELADLEQLMAPLASKPATQAQRESFARAVVAARKRDRRNDRTLWIAAACALVGLLLHSVLQFDSGLAEPGLRGPQGSSEPLPTPERIEIAELPLTQQFEDGATIRHAGDTDFELQRSKGPTRSLQLEGGRLRLRTGDVDSWFVRIGRRRLVVDQDSEVDVRWSTPELEVLVLAGTAEIRGPSERFQLVASSRTVAVPYGDRTSTRMTTPTLPRTTRRLASILEKFDRRPEGDGARFPFDLLTDAAENSADTYALWCLLDTAEQRDWSAAEQPLTRALERLAGRPQDLKGKTPTPTLADWRRHLSSGWR